MNVLVLYTDQQQRWKLNVNVGDPSELYDRATDPGELRNVIEEQPSVYVRMRNRLYERYHEQP